MTIIAELNLPCGRNLSGQCIDLIATALMN
jgi:hypothetical protein